MLTLTLALLACPGFAQYTADDISEPSGLVASRQHAGVFWTHNDSGDAARIFAVTADGRLLREYAVEGAEAEDWEDIAVDDAGRLYIGDIGNNKNKRRNLKVYVVAEPNPTEATKGPLKVERVVRYHFPDQAEFPPKARNFDAEALFWAQSHLYLLTKHRGDMRTNLYRFEDLTRADSQPLTKIGAGFFLGGDPARYGGMVTGADATRDGAWLAVLTYHAVFLFPKPKAGDDYLSSTPKRIDLEQDKTIQAEAIAWERDETLYFTNEQRCIFKLDRPQGKKKRVKDSQIKFNRCIK